MANLINEEMQMKSINTVVLEQLEANDWVLNRRMRSITGSPSDWVTQGTKVFETMLGQRQATTFWVDWESWDEGLPEKDEPNLLLSGEFITEGKNILSTSSVLIPKISTPDEVKALVNDFSEKVGRAISEARIVRLIAPDEDAPAMGAGVWLV